MLHGDSGSRAVNTINPFRSIHRHQQVLNGCGYRSRSLLTALFLMVLLSACPVAVAGQTSALRLSTSDPQIQSAFDWAKTQALAYVSSGHDPVKYFYESALPGRDAFCMRDVSHQLMGAEALGLSTQNKTMLSLFAKNISESKDWAGYWEIDREGKPSTSDYVNENDFWYNLPANFDVMSAAFRAYMWTGDSDYISSSIFLDFYRHTVTDYIQRWQLDPGNVLSRKRIMNRHQESGKFVDSRGIPSYTEGQVNFTLGTDLLAAEYRALRWYGEFLRMSGSAASAQNFDAKAAGIAHILSSNGWDAAGTHFYGFLRPDERGFGDGDAFVLYFNAAVDAQQSGASLNALLRQTQAPDPGIEEQSYRPEILYRYGSPEDAYGQILDLSHPDRKRREYPEVSYAVIGSMVTGMMGVQVLPADKPAGALLSNNVVIRTLPQLSTRTSWAELDNLPIRHNVINIRHIQNRSTTITNVSGPAFTWRSSFRGFSHSLRVDGKKLPAMTGKTAEGIPVVYRDVTVPPGKVVTVRE